MLHLTWSSRAVRNTAQRSQHTASAPVIKQSPVIGQADIFRLHMRPDGMSRMQVVL